MNLPLRIGYVVRMFPRFSETFVLQEILELERQGVEVSIFSLNKPNEGRFHPALARLRAQIHYLDDREAKRWWAWLPSEWGAIGPDRTRMWQLIDEIAGKQDGADLDTVFYAAGLAAKCRALGLHALHAHFATVSCSLAYYASRIAGIPYSFTAHAKDIFSDSVDRELLTSKINAARFVVTVTEYNKRFLVEQHPGADASRIRVLYNGVDREYFSPDETIHRSRPSVIMAVGRLVAKKGFADLIRACAILKSRGQSFRCVIIGQGREEPRLRDLATEVGVDDHLELAGARHQEEVRDMMRSATALCLPCLRDTDGNQDALPTVLLEAMAVGLPVVSTRISGVPEIIDTDLNGLMVEPGDPERLAEGLARILTDPEFAQRLSVAGRQKASERFDIRRNVTTLHAWLREREVNVVDSRPISTGTEGGRR